MVPLVSWVLQGYYISSSILGSTGILLFLQYLGFYKDIWLLYYPGLYRDIQFLYFPGFSYDTMVPLLSWALQGYYGSSNILDSTVISWFLQYPGFYRDIMVPPVSWVLQGYYGSSNILGSIGISQFLYYPGFSYDTMVSLVSWVLSCFLVLLWLYNSSICSILDFTILHNFEHLGRFASNI